MGERTQALITVKYGNSKTKASVSIHYQWGYGRYMLMDVLNQGIYLTELGRSRPSSIGG
ncbi:hypothetical protein SKA67_15000 [Enterococcus faecium]